MRVPVCDSALCGRFALTWASLATLQSKVCPMRSGGLGASVGLIDADVQF